MCVHNITHIFWKNNPTSSSFTTVIFSRSTAGTTVCALTTTTIPGKLYDLGFSTLSYESVRNLEYGPVVTTVQLRCRTGGCQYDSTFFNGDKIDYYYSTTVRRFTGTCSRYKMHISVGVSESRGWMSLMNNVLV